MLGRIISNLLLGGGALLASWLTGRGWVLSVPFAALMGVASLYLGCKLAGLLVSYWLVKSGRRPALRPVSAGPIAAPFVIQVTAKMTQSVFMVGGILLHGGMPGVGARFVVKRTGRNGSVGLMADRIQAANVMQGNRVVLGGDIEAIRENVTFSPAALTSADVQIGDFLIGL